jgi:hypothetical protein
LDKLIEKYKNSQSYIIVVFITVSATIFVMKGSSDSTFIENVNFASTLTSIVLSIIAIILTLIESSKNDSSIERMHQASMSVNESTKILNESKAKIQEFIVKMTEAQEDIKYTREDINKVMKRYESNSPDEKKNTKAESHKTEKTNISKTDFNKLVWTVPHAIRQYLLLISKAYEHNVILDIDDFNKFYNKILIKDDLTAYEIYDGLITTLYILQGFELIKFKFTDDWLLKITYIDKELIKAINNLVPDEECFEDSPALRYYGSVCSYFKELKNRECFHI